MEGGGFEPPKLARQIYSLIPLATREPLQKGAHSLDLDTRCQQALRGNSALPASHVRAGGTSYGKRLLITSEITEIGAGERNRTPDRLITNQLLYLLSYAS